jgi:hypothetical protein
VWIGGLLKEALKRLLFCIFFVFLFCFGKKKTFIARSGEKE